MFSRVSLILWIVLSFTQLQAQLSPVAADTIRVSRIRLYENISAQAGLYIDSTGKIDPVSPGPLPALDTLSQALARKIPARFVNRDFYLQFNLYNDTDSASTTVFLPGFYYKEIELFKRNTRTGQFERQPERVLPQVDFGQNNPVVGILYLEKGEAATYIARLRFIKTTVNVLHPRISQEFYFPSLLNLLQHERQESAVITYLICGIMLMMILYSVAAYQQNRNVEFLYYSAYAFLLGLMFFLKAWLFKYPSKENFLFESYADFMLQCTGTIFYFLFLRSFSNAREDFPMLDRVLMYLQWLTISGMAIFTWLNFFTNNFPLQNLVENLIKYSWSFCTIFVIGYSILNRTTILRYLAIGHSFLFVGGLLSLFLINSSQRFTDTRYSLVNDSLFWYELGILFELVFFLVALSYKTRQDITARAREKERLLMEYEKTAIEKQMAVLAAKQEERNRISADMHDELGSGVTAIRLMSELAKTKMKEQTLPEIEKISHSANELISKMNTIIWTMQSSNDTVDNMVAYVRSYAYEFLDNADIECKVDYPDDIPSIELTGEKRRNIFLCIKEALNNIVKHSGATVVHIRFRLGPHLVVQIQDNGVGIEPGKMREFSNGMTNMRKRMESIDGHFGFRSIDGTIITLSIPLQ